MDICELMPSMVDLVGAQSDSGRTGFAERWTLSRLGGAALDQSMTLDDNGVRDGEHLLLTTESPSRGPDFTDLSDYVVDASNSARTCAGLSQRLGSFAWVWSAVVGAATLAWPNSASQSSRAVTAAIVAVAVAVAAVIASRADVEPFVALSFGASGAVFGALAGYLAVPGGPMPPNFFLAAAVCAAVSTVLLHVTGCGVTLYVAIASLSLTVAVVAGSATIWPSASATLGAILATASVGMLSVAAKLTVALTGLSPRMGTAFDVVDRVSLAERSHRVLTGLLAGFSLSATVGTMLVIVDLSGASTCSRIAFTGAVCAALIFRACRQLGAVRSTLMLCAGLVCTTAAFTLTVASAPQHIAWSSLGAVALGTGSLCLTRANLGSRLSPFTRRGLEATEYLVLVTLVPMACWVGGVFGLVRGLGLT
jgi:type VII secretion integral membrane protein EccD